MKSSDPGLYRLEALEARVLLSAQGLVEGGLAHGAGVAAPPEGHVIEAAAAQSGQGTVKSEFNWFDGVPVEELQTDGKQGGPNAREVADKGLAAAPEEGSNASAIAGSKMKVQSGFALASPQLTTASGTLGQDTSWSGTVSVTNNFAIAAGVRLSIQPGTVVKVAAGATITVGGTLDAQGTTTQPIIFTSAKDDSAGQDISGAGTTTGTAGDWESINFEGGSSASVLANLEVRFAGMSAPGNNDFRDAILVRGGSAPTLRDVKVRDVAWTGVRLVDGKATLQRVDVQGSGNVPFHFDLAADPVIDGITGSNNKTEGLKMTGGTLPGDRTWGVTSMPYMLTGDLAVPNSVTLTLGPGVVVKMAGGAYFQVSGTLSAHGSALAPVIVTSQKDDTAGGDTFHDGSATDTAPAGGDWEALYLESGSSASVLEFVEVRYAGMSAPGNNDFRDAILVRGGSAPTLRDVKVRNVAWTGVRMLDGKATLQRVDVQGAGNVPFHFDLAADPVIDGITGANNKAEGVWITTGGLAGARTWAVTSMPYMVTGDLRILNDATLTLRPGVVVKMNPGSWLAVDGTLLTQGTVEAPVVITSQKDDSVGGDTLHDGSAGDKAPGRGDWESVYFEGGSSGSILERTDIRYAGQSNPGNNDPRNAVDIASGLTPTLRNLRVLHAFSHGIWVHGDSKPHLEGVQVEDANGYPVVLDLAADPVISGLGGNNDLSDAIYIAGGTLSADRLWDYGPLPIQLGADFRLGAGLKLTIAPGTVVKVPDGAWVAIDGNLQAIGTAARPIIFTSSHDDSAGGDSNGDGQTTTPTRGLWETAYFETGSSLSVLDHVEIRYGGQTNPGNNDPRPLVDIAGGQTPAIKNTILKDSFSNGIWVHGDAAPVLQDVQVTRANGFALVLDLAANPSIHGLAALNNLNNAIYVAGGTLTTDRVWEYGSLPIQLGSDFRLATGATLTVAPGTVVKMPDGAYVAIDGNLQAIGTAAAPIVFTSVHDDEAGGDTNADGTDTVPVPGHWESMYFENGSTGSVLDHVEVAYAGESNPGNNDRHPTIDINGGDITIKNSRITQAASAGIQVRGNNTLTLTDSVLANLRGAGLVVSAGTAKVTGTAFASAPMGVSITPGASATVTGSAFTALSDSAAQTANTDFALANFTGNWWGAADGPNDASAADGRVNNNPAGAAVGDFIDYGTFLNAAPVLAAVAPFIRSLTPAVSGTALPAVDVTFSEPMDLSTFTAADVAVTGPSAATVGTITLRSGGTYRINFTSPLTVTGNYQIRIGPNIASAAGYLLDQDRDGRTGEANEDVFVATVQIDNTGPRVISQDPVGTVDQAVDTVTVDFSEPIVVDTFGPEDVLVHAKDPPTAPVAGFLVSTYQARYGLGDLPTALTVLGGNWTKLTTVNAPFIDYGGGGLFPNNQPFPGGVVDLFVTIVTGKLNIPSAGDWTFGVSSDDGYRLRINGQEASFAGLRGMATPDLLVVNFAAAGQYDLELLHFENGGGEGLEFSAAAGKQTAFTSDFHLVGDTANGGLAVTADRVDNSSLPVLSVTPVNPQLATVNRSETAPFDGRGFAVRTVYSNVPLGDLSAALAVLADPATQSRVLQENVPMINYYGTGEGVFSTSNRPFQGQQMGQDADRFIVQATAKVTIPAPGDWTFGVNSDDGFSLKVGANESSFPGLRPSTTSLATWTFASAGQYDLQLVYFENTGGDQLELFAAPGKHDAFDSDFRLVGDTALGGLAVQSTAVTPSGDLPVTRVTQVATRFVVRFEPVSANGAYQIEILPNLADQAGNLMDQNGNGTGGEDPQDRYVGQLVIDRKPFRVLATDPTGVAPGALDHLDVTFSAPVQTSSFGIGDVEVFGPLVTAKILGVDPISATQFRVRIDPVTAEGDYTIRIGPAISDIGGNLLNQDQDLVGGELEDRYVATIRVENVSPFVRDHKPIGVIGAPIAAIDLTMSEPVVLSSFTPEDVVLTGPSGAIPVTLVTLLSGSTYRLAFAPQTASGEYAFTVGPDITDLGGKPLDQDQDGVSGERTDDVYRGKFTVDSSGPRIITASLTGQTPAPLSQITVEFNEDIDLATFTAQDVLLSGAGGAIPVAVQSVDKRHFTLNFAQQTVGQLTLKVGPAITDVLGNPMDQNQNGVNGEVGDAFSVSGAVQAPNLVVASRTVPSSAVNGQTITITWTVKNTGSAPAKGPWTDRVVLSRDDVYGNGDDLPLGTFQRTDDLANDPAASYQGQVSAQVPFGIDGAFKVLIATDSARGVLESDENNNVATAPIAIGSSLPPNDLIVELVTAPATAQTGASISVSWKVKNQGTAETSAAAWLDRVFLSDDDVFGNDVLLGTFEHTGTLASNASYTATQTLLLPVDLTVGAKRIFVQTDAINQVNEPAADDNNTGRSDVLNLTPAPVPDLVVSAVSGPVSAAIGQPVSLTWTVRNQGQAAAAVAWIDRLFISADGTLNGARPLAGFARNNPLAPGAEYSRTESVKLPVVADGEYFLIVVADGDNSVFERAGETNNRTATAQAVAVAHPDLVVDVVNVPATGISGTELTIRWTVTNQWEATTPAAWLDRLFLPPTTRCRVMTRFWASWPIPGRWTHWRATQASLR